MVGGKTLMMLIQYQQNLTRYTHILSVYIFMFCFKVISTKLEVKYLVHPVCTKQVHYWFSKP